jgi:molybdopterin biosynthesis enzyme MoaB
VTKFNRSDCRHKLRIIAKSLDKIGVEINEMISIRDDKTHILETFEKLQNTVDLVIITGGLGLQKMILLKKHFVIILMMSSLLMKSGAPCN